MLCNVPHGFDVILLLLFSFVQKFAPLKYGGVHRWERMKGVISPKTFRVYKVNRIVVVAVL